MTDTSDKKTIHINPELFKLDTKKGGTTRKNRKPKHDNQKPIKVKSSEKSANTSTLKKSLLKMIRNHQQTMKPKEPIPMITQDTVPPKTEFEQSMQFLSKLNEKQPSDDHNNKTKLKRVKNQTIRNVIPLRTPDTPKSNVVPSTIAPMITLDKLPMLNNTEPPVVIYPPKPYGCLKNGKLPTYKMWKNNTQKILPTNTIQPLRKTVTELCPSESMKQYEEKLNDRIVEFSKQSQWETLNNTINPVIHKPCKKQRRILRRTFHVGKSKKYPHVSVLVSNKTIRNNTNLKCIDLKQSSMKDVKQYLLKQGLIKVGTTTPNDVLRKLYESAKLIPGEVKNYNPENLLYNYFNEDPEVS
jgi:hypothetical protein